MRGIIAAAVLAIVLMSGCISQQTVVQPAPTAMQFIVNDGLKQCGSYWPGDEFTQYNLPSGWKTDDNVDIASDENTAHAESECGKLGYTYIGEINNLEPVPLNQPTVNPETTEQPLCNNSKYSTQYYGDPYINDNLMKIGIASEDNGNFYSSLSEKGNLALSEISDLKCLEVLQLGEKAQRLYSFTYPSDISALSTLTNLKRLELGHTHISDITPLAGMTKLVRLDISYTLVSDITPLSNLISLRTLILSKSKVSAEDCDWLKTKLIQTDITC